ncbi:hypothetical protein B0H17DRAFT_1212125 [Mycena rosella]|uniref:SAP domain-containing protein n=1 Tax=Mycena rosella TaxID=1033263 RepID=A0AAD7CTD4_MYCRO|nr:hypothetical protein B0H17DRAFT_1212125 [Mycena rosella]
MPPRAPPPIIPLELIRAGPIHSSRTVGDLTSIASAMGMDATGKKKDLLGRVQSKLESNKGLAQKPEFMKFSVYRAEKTSKTSSKNVKNSAEKAAEDAAESKQDIPATGANHTLLAAKANSDPPPQYKRLEALVTTEPVIKGDINKDSGEDEDDGSPICSSPEPDEGPRTPPASKDQKFRGFIPKTPVPIIVAFNGANKREIIIQSSDRVLLTVENEGADGGPATYSTSLKAMLTGAINSDTPMKANMKAKIFRTGVIDPDAPLKLGSIEEILSAETVGNLRIPAVDKHNLQTFQDGMLVCDVFLVNDGDTTVSSLSAPMFIAPKGEEKPPIVAHARAAAAAVVAAQQKASEDTQSPRLKFIGSVFNARDSPWPHATYVRTVRDRYTAVEDAVAQAHVLGWNRSGGGYPIPFTYEEATFDGHDFRGTVFTKADLQSALHIAHAAAGTDRKTKDLLEYCEQAAAWFKDPDHARWGPKFNEMTPVDFKKRLERKRDEAVAERARERRRAHQLKAEGKKRKIDTDSEGLDGSASAASGSDEERAPKKKQLPKKKLTEKGKKNVVSVDSDS